MGKKTKQQQQKPISLLDPSFFKSKTIDITQVWNSTTQSMSLIEQAFPR